MIYSGMSSIPIPVSADSDVSPLVDLMADRRVVVLAGAGCSTESGIPDYRGPQGRLRTRKPVQYGDFVRSHDTRTRYWARSAIGWTKMAQARANAAHRGLARLEEGDVVVGLITQNVDGLHQAGGSRRVLELHGSLAHVVCLSCGRRVPRDVVQDWIEERNAEWITRASAAGADGEVPESAPDGDAEVRDELHGEFLVPDCDRCYGLLKPDVVFFGENVPRQRVDEAWRLVDRAEVLLVVGSSLTVYSGRRFIYGAQERRMPIGVANMGPTRADEVASAKVEGRLGDVIPRLADALLGT